MDTEAIEHVASLVDEAFMLDAVRGALAIPSISGEEEDVARYFAGLMQQTGLQTELQPVPATAAMAASYNTIGRLQGSGGGCSLLINGHMDHNPVSDGWTKNPFGAEVDRDGWIYGFVHMKAADACYLAAVDAVRRSGITLTGDLAIALVCGELRGGTGTRHALSRGLGADYFLLGEPTELQLANTHSSSRVVHIHVLGRSKHFATNDTPDRRGVNAVEQASRVIAALRPSHVPLKPASEGGFLDFTPMPGFEGLPQLNIGPIEGGISRSYNKTRPALFPDVCTLTVDFRLIPGMTREGLEADLRRLLDGLRGEEPEFRYEIEFAPDTFPVAFNAPRDSRIANSVARVHQAVHGSAATWSDILRFAASDAAWMDHAGITGIVYGPTGRYLSRPDERCEVKDLLRATQVFAGVIADICTADRHHQGELP